MALGRSGPGGNFGVWIQDEAGTTRAALSLSQDSSPILILSDSDHSSARLPSARPRMAPPASDFMARDGVQESRFRTMLTDASDMLPAFHS